jgi:small multidrug resistance pump
VKSWLFLGIAIVAEVVATSGLKASEGFTKLWPSLLVIAGYAVAFYFLSITLKEIPVGVAYAIWAGMGVVLVTLIGWLIYGQSLDAASVIGMALIISGVVVINVFSKSVAH